MNEDEKRKFKKSELHDIEMTISRKLSFIRILIDNANLNMNEINKILKNMDFEKQGNNIHFNNIYLIYRGLVYFESTVIQMTSILDLLMKYISIYFKSVLDKNIGQTKILKMLKEEGIDIEGKRELYFVRKIVTHHYSGWLSLQKANNHFQIIINFPDSINRFKDYKRYKYKNIEMEKINDLFDKFSNFHDNVIKWFIKMIQKNNFGSFPK
jgi:hypothetical protein